MASINDILLYFNAVDNVTPVAQQIDSQVSGGMGNMNTATGGLIGTVRELSGVFSGLNGLVMGTFGMFGLSNFKQMTYGYATAREELLSLHNSIFKTTEAEAEASDHLWNTMDELTNQGYVQLDDLTQVMSNFAMSTGASAEQSERMATIVNKVGNTAILMGKDSYSTMALMQSAVGGVNGQLNMMRIHLGVTKDKLKSLGWSGEASDLEGYMTALETYLSRINTNDLLGSTEGKVISLQKRFRIAGRNIGNYMLPPINKVLDAITNLNAESNDLLATVVILSTGFMSGFASIMPTLNPLLSTYDILKRNFGKDKTGKDVCEPYQQEGRCVSAINTLLNTHSSRLSSLTAPLKNLTSNVKDFIAVPFVNYLRQVISNHTAWIRTPIVSFLGRVSSALGLANTRLLAFASRTKASVLAPFTSALGRLRDVLGQVSKRLATFILNYGKLNTVQSISDKLMGKGLDPNSMVTNPNAKNTVAQAVRRVKVGGWKSNYEGRQAQKIKEETEAIMEQYKAVSKHTLMMEANNIAKGESILASEGQTVANTEETLSEDLNTFAKIRNTIATWMNTAGEEANIGAKLWAIVVNLKDVAVKKLQAVWTAILNVLNLELLIPILLIVGAIASLIAIVNEIGKTLGWWDDWKSMLEAIVNGLKRLWSAFVNNPNVQGFINDIKGLFGALGGTIQWVAWQVLQFFGWKDDGSEVDIVRGIIDAFGTLGRVMGDIVNVFKTVFGAIYTVTAPIVGAIVWVIRSIICILLGCSPGIVPALFTVRDTFRKIFSEMANFINDPIGTIVRVLQLWQKMLFTVARNIGLSIWNGINSVLGGIPQKVWQTFWNMLNNLKQIPQMIWGTAQDIGQQAYNGLDSAVSGLTGGLIHLPGATNGQQNARTNARTMGNATKNYNNSRNMNRGHTINIGQGAIQLDARNLTTKESKQIMINALEGLTTYETVHTKKATGSK